jgi:uncharacterized membrane protein
MANLKHGVLAGIIAGAVFGMMMLVMMPATLGNIAKLYGLSGTTAGFVVHLVHSGVIGWSFTWFIGESVSVTAGSVYGLLYGFVWWILGPILIMPTWLAGSPRLSAEGVQAALPSLPGHLVFGLVLGFLYVLWNKSSKTSSPAQPEA